MSSDLVAQSTVDGIAQKLFTLADKADRAGNSNKWVHLWCSVLLPCHSPHIAWLEGLTIVWLELGVARVIPVCGFSVA